MQLEVKTILNRIQHFVGFVYQEVRLHGGRMASPGWIEVTLAASSKASGAGARECRRPAPGYDRLPERRWLFVPLWGM